METPTAKLYYKMFQKILANIVEIQNNSRSLFSTCYHNNNDISKCRELPFKRIYLTNEFSDPHVLSLKGLLGKL